MPLCLLCVELLLAPFETAPAEGWFLSQQFGEESPGIKYPFDIIGLREQWSLGTFSS